MLISSMVLIHAAIHLMDTILLYQVRFVVNACTANIILGFRKRDIMSLC